MNHKFHPLHSGAFLRTDSLQFAYFRANSHTFARIRVISRYFALLLVTSRTHGKNRNVFGHFVAAAL